jgi:hypothetical protein
MWVSIWPILAQPEGTDWFRHLDSLLPIILVVLVGLLTLVKRGVEIILKRRAEARRSAPPSPTARAGTSRPQAEPSEATVFEEMRRYFEILEGRQPGQKPPATPSKPRPASTRPPAAPRRSLAPPQAPQGPPRPTAPPRPKPATAEELFSLPSGSDSVDAAAHRVEEISSEGLRAGLRSEFKGLGASVSVSHAELARGSGPAKSRRLTLDQVALRRDPKSVRAAILWSEILGKPRHERPF